MRKPNQSKSAFAYEAPLSHRTYIDPLRDIDHGLPDAVDRFESRMKGMQEGLLEELFIHYFISPDHPAAWERLAKSLAYDHVPAFRFTFRKPKGRGAPKKRTRAASSDFVSAVEAARKEIAAKRSCEVEKVSVLAAVTGALKRNPNKWKDRRGGSLSPQSGATRYYQMKALAHAEPHNPFPTYK
jgi:hypothetical protein